MKARGYAPQLTAYRRVLEAAGGRRVVSQVMHFPVGGRIAEMIDAVDR
jgi:predicted enzyme related to lactoylglutathione lyase